MKKGKVDELALKFARKVKRMFPDAKIILFGSRAREDALKTSDYDFIIVSKSFKNIPFFERPILLYTLWDGGGIDLLCYTPEEFEKKKKQISVVKEAVRDGIEISE